MPLIVEDGTGVANANSYVNIAYARAYALERNYTLPASDATLEQYLIRAMDWLEAKRASFQGSKTLATQALQWPRLDVYIDCEEFASNAIPVELKKAQAELAIAINSGSALFPPSPTSSMNAGPVTRKIVGPIEMHYSDKAAYTTGITSDGTYRIPTVENLLKPLFSACGNGAFVKTVRI
jgi:hypothetical protein